MRFTISRSKIYQVLLFTLSLVMTVVLVVTKVKSTESAAFTFPYVPPDFNTFSILTPAAEKFRFIKTGATTCGQYSMVEAVIPPGAGPLPHIHHRQDEWFYFPDGGLTLQMGDNLYPDIHKVPGANLPKERLHLVKTTPGSLFYSTRYHVHGFTNSGKEPKRIVFIWAPDDPVTGITNYFKAVGQPLPDPSNPPPVDPKNKALFVSQAPKYGINQSASFNQYVAKVDDNLHEMDNHANELLALLAPDLKGGQRQQGGASCQ